MNIGSIVYLIYNVTSINTDTDIETDYTFEKLLSKQRRNMGQGTPIPKN